MPPCCCRDNVLHRTQHRARHLRAIAQARREVIIANAYFMPGDEAAPAPDIAARRGVRVQLPLQGALRNIS